jgi:hypothetical protein
MNELETKKLLIGRIVAHFNPVPANAVQELLSQSVGELEVILENLASKKAQGDANEMVEAHRKQSRRESQLEGAWVHAFRNVNLNGRRLVDCESNRSMFESLLQAHEEPSGSIYGTLALQFPTKFSWETPQAKPTKEDQRAAFDAFVRENNLSSVEANFNLFTEGASAEHFAGASGIERAQYAKEAAQARQTFLIKHATPQQLKQEAAYESQVNREQAQREEADRQHQFVSQQQQGLYAVLPAVNANGETMDSKYFRRISTVDYPLFKQLVRKFGSAQITERLRTPEVVVTAA